MNIKPILFNTNTVEVIGLLQNGLYLSHEKMGEKFYAGTLKVKRLSGAEDLLPSRFRAASTSRRKPSKTAPSRSPASSAPTTRSSATRADCLSTSTPRASKQHRKAR